MNVHVAPNFDDMRHEAAATFLRGLFEPADTICLWLIHQMTKEQKQFIQPLDQIAEPVTFAQLDKMQDDGWNVYVCMNPLKTGSKRRIKENVAQIRSAYLDIDVDGPERLVQLKAAVKAGEIPAPRFIVETSPGKYHVSWRLEGATPEEQEQLNKRLVARFGGDSAATDCVRVLRIPGFSNLKYAEEPLVMLLAQRAGQATLDQFKISAVPVDKKPPVDLYAPIETGHRNTELTRRAGKLHRAGLSEESILRELLEINERCDDPLDPSEVAVIAHSIGSLPPDEDTDVSTLSLGGVWINGPLRGQPVAGYVPTQPIVTDYRTLLQGNFNDGTASWILRNVQKASDLSSKPIEWLIEEMIFKTGLHLFSGKQGSMKSMLALMLAKRLATSESFMGRKNIGEQIMVVYVDKENPQSEVRRRCAALGLLGLENFRIWGDWQIDCPPPLTFDDPRLLECARRDKPFFMFDSLSSFLDGAGENDTGEMMAIMGKARLLARQSSGVSILHHQAKNGLKGSRGNTAIPASTDMAFCIEKEGDKVTISEERFRMCAGYEMQFEMDFGGTTGIYTPKVINNGLAGMRAVKPVTELPEWKREQMAQHHADMLLEDRAKDEIKKAYAEGKTVNQNQLSILTGIVSNRVKSRVLNGAPDKPWRCVSSGRGQAVFFIPKDAPGLPVTDDQESDAA